MKPLKIIRYYSRLLVTFAKKQQKLIGLGMIFGALIFLLSPRVYQQVFRKEPQRIGLVGRYPVSNLPSEIQNLLSQGLVQLAPDGSPQPAIAAEWKTEKKGKRYLFTIKDGLFWQDGTPLKAKDINYQFSDVTTNIIDEKTVVFDLMEPFSPFPTIVSRPVFKKGFIGIGDYILKSLSQKGEIVEKIVLKSQGESGQNLIYRFYPTEEAAKTAFKLGEVDTLKKIANLEGMENWPGAEIYQEVEKSYYVAVFFNTQDKFLADKSLRQALAYAIEKKWEPRALSPVNPESWAYNPGVKPYNYDSENARKLLEKLKEEGGEEALPESIELTTLTSLLPVAESIAENWRELGIETKVKVFSGLTGDFQALLVTQEIPPDPDQYTLWHSTQVTNITGQKNPKIDKLLEDGRKIQDQEGRKEIYFDFQRFLVEETPAIFLYHPTFYTIKRK